MAELRVPKSWPTFPAVHDVQDEVLDRDAGMRPSRTPSAPHRLLVAGLLKADAFGRNVLPELATDSFMRKSSSAGATCR